MCLEEIIVNKYPLISKADVELECYLVEPYHYIVFWEEFISKNELKDVLKKVILEFSNGHFPHAFAFVIVGKTNDTHNNDELLYYYQNGATVAFYLVDENRQIAYFNNRKRSEIQWSCKKMIAKINSIVSPNLTNNEVNK